MIEYPLDDGGVLDARNDPEPAATAPAPFNLDRKDPLEALGPGHRTMPRAGRLVPGSRPTPHRGVSLVGPKGEPAEVVARSNDHYGIPNLQSQPVPRQAQLKAARRRRKSPAQPG